MFNLRNWLMAGFRSAIGNLADYQIILNATGWYDKGALMEEDLAEIQELLGIKNTDPEVEQLKNENADMKEALDILEVTDESEPVESTEPTEPEEVIE